MRRYLALLLAMLLLCMPALAEEEFSGLNALAELVPEEKAGGLDALMELLPPEPLPDPAELVGSEGSLLAEDFQYSADYLCDAYLYANPENWDGFFLNYEAMLVESGYTATLTEDGGRVVYRLEQAGTGECALLVPNFQGHMLLLIQQGMAFAAAAEEPAAAPDPTLKPTAEPTPEPTPEPTAELTPAPTPEEDYLQVTCNGWDVRMHGFVHTKDDIGALRRYSLWFQKSDDMYIDNIWIYFPRYIQAGTEYYASLENPNSSASIQVEGSELNGDYVSSAKSGSTYKEAITSKGDYFYLMIESITETEDTAVITGTFEAQFLNGSEVLENGSFRATVPNR